VAVPIFVDAFISSINTLSLAPLVRISMSVSGALPANSRRASGCDGGLIAPSCCLSQVIFGVQTGGRYRAVDLRCWSGDGGAADRYRGTVTAEPCTVLGSAWSPAGCGAESDVQITSGCPSRVGHAGVCQPGCRRRLTRDAVIARGARIHGQRDQAHL